MCPVSIQLSIEYCLNKPSIRIESSIRVFTVFISIDHSHAVYDKFEAVESNLAARETAFVFAMGRRHKLDVAKNPTLGLNHAFCKVPTKESTQLIRYDVNY